MAAGDDDDGNAMPARLRVLRGEEKLEKHSTAGKRPGRGTAQKNRRKNGCRTLLQPPSLPLSYSAPPSPPGEKHPSRLGSEDETRTLLLLMLLPSLSVASIERTLGVRMTADAEGASGKFGAPIPPVCVCVCVSVPVRWDGRIHLLGRPSLSRLLEGSPSFFLLLRLLLLPRCLFPGFLLLIYTSPPKFHPQWRLRWPSSNSNPASQPASHRAHRAHRGFPLPFFSSSSRQTSEHPPVRPYLLPPIHPRSPLTTRAPWPRDWDGKYKN